MIVTIQIARMLGAHQPNPTDPSICRCGAAVERDDSRPPTVPPMVWHQARVIREVQAAQTDPDTQAMIDHVEAMEAVEWASIRDTALLTHKVHDLRVERTRLRDIIRRAQEHFERRFTTPSGRRTTMLAILGEVDAVPEEEVRE